MVERVECPSLRGNPLGDPVERIVPVLVPRRETASGSRFPVVFVLAGFGGAGRSFLNWHGWTPTFPERADRLRSDGRIGDVILVFPDGFTRYGGSQYIDSAGTGAYGRMLTADLVSWVEDRFPTLPGARHRAIIGKSSGGYGAVVHGMLHPDVFSAVACHSGDMYFEYCYKHDFPRLLKALDRHGGLRGFIDAFFAAPKKTSDLVLAMNVVAMAAVYSPNASSPCGIDLPVDPETGELVPHVWARWQEHDPVTLCARHVERLRRLRLLYLDCGKADQFHLQYGQRILSRRLKALGVEHVAEEFDDDHSDTSYRYEVSLPRVWEAIRE